MKYLHTYTLSITGTASGINAVVSFESDNAIPTKTEFFNAVSEVPEFTVPLDGSINISKRGYAIISVATFLNQ